MSGFRGLYGHRLFYFNRKRFRKNDKRILCLLNFNRNWKTYKVSDLFDVKYGINIDLNKCIETTRQDKLSVNYVSRTSQNNGVTARVKLIEEYEPQPAGVITCAGVVAFCQLFYKMNLFIVGEIYICLYLNLI